MFDLGDLLFVPNLVVAVQIGPQVGRLRPSDTELVNKSTQRFHNNNMYSLSVR